MSIKNLDPKIVWKNFYAMTQIPRPSKREGKAVIFLENFGKNLGLDTIKDELGNIIIRKPATPGMEDRKGIILQSHMDMVPQKKNDKVHDWDNDPIETKIVGDWVYADDTTLGADDGMGCAISMSVLESKDLVHGPIEALFTIDEETGMTGAQGLKGGLLKGDILFNMDSETEGELYIGCAGGADVTATFDYELEDVPAGYKGLQIDVKGLLGGHSGMEINQGRANANKLMARALLPILRNLNGRLGSVAGGTLRNAIPLECVATVAVPEANLEKAKKVVSDLFANAANEYGPVEKDLHISAKPCEVTKVMKGDVAMRATIAVYACLSGVARFSLTMDNMVETSNNLAVFHSENGKITIMTLARGSIDSAKEDLIETVKSPFILAGANVKVSGEYPGWQPNVDSEILSLCQKVYKDLFGEEPAVKAIHAGLECGILSTNYKHWDMVSCGPTICSPHSPLERVEIASIDKWWRFVKEVLKEAPVKK